MVRTVGCNIGLIPVISARWDGVMVAYKVHNLMMKVRFFLPQLILKTMDTLDKIKDILNYLDIGFVTSKNVLLINLNKIKEMNTNYEMLTKMIADDFNEEKLIKERYKDFDKKVVAEDKINPFNGVSSEEKVKPFTENSTKVTNNGDWRARLLIEYYELSDRLKKLRRTLVKINAGTIEFKGKSTMEMLYNQEKAMDTYKQILELRLEKEGIEFSIA